MTLVCTNLIGPDRELEILVVRNVRPPDGKSLLSVELEDVDDLSTGPLLFCVGPQVIDHVVNMVR